MSVTGAQVYNFYSSTEDVLRAYKGDDIAHFSEIVKKLFEQGGGKEAVRSYLSQSTWVKQEKFKGRRSFFDIFDNSGGVSSSYCGWSFNSVWDVSQVPPVYSGTSIEIKVRMNPSDVAADPKLQPAPLLDYPEILKNTPFFNLPTFKLFGVDLADLVSAVPKDPGPSDFVKKKISETGLKDYYKKNLAAQSKVKVRDWLLAEAFPATTLPMGANKNPVFLKSDQNINMSEESSEQYGKCCKTSEDLWPRDDTFIPNVGDWKHSDYKDVPYQHVYEFYKKIKVLIQ